MSQNNLTEHLSETASEMLTTQSAFTYTNLTIETLGQGVKYVQN